MHNYNFYPIQSERFAQFLNTKLRLLVLVSKTKNINIYLFVYQYFIKHNINL